MPLVLAATTPGEPEIFASLQGEGPSQGRPCAFVRLSRCNLACVWCDTAYTWRFTGDNRPHRAGQTFERKANQVALSEEEAATRIAALGQDRLVVTGGEPLLQAPALARMLALLPDKRVEIETNGTVAPSAALVQACPDFNVSPKLRNSDVASERRIVPQALRAFARSGLARFKFVVQDSADLAEIEELEREFGLSPIWVMPEGTTQAAVLEGMRALVEEAASRGWRLGSRMHVLLWGDERGR